MRTTCTIYGSDGSVIAEDVSIELREGGRDQDGYFSLPRGAKYIPAGSTIHVVLEDGRSGVLIIQSMQDGSHQGEVGYRFFVNGPLR